MDGLYDYLDSFWLIVGGGAALVVTGIVLLVVARDNEPEQRRTLKWIGWPMVGCGGCLLSIPLAMVGALILLGLTILGFCSDSASC